MRRVSRVNCATEANFRFHFTAKACHEQVRMCDCLLRLHVIVVAQTDKRDIAICVSFLSPLNNVFLSVYKYWLTDTFDDKAMC